MKQKIKVLHLIHSLGNGGWENVLLRLLPLLSDDFDHHILTLRLPGELAPKFKAAGITVTTVHQRSLVDILSYGRLLAAIKKFRPNVIISYLFHADAIARCFLQPLLGFSFLRTQRPVIVPYLGTTYNFSRYWFARVFERATKYFVSHYLANSPAVKSYYVENLHVRQEKITVMTTGIDTDYFAQLTPDVHLRDSLGLKSTDFVIICVANLHSNKGHRYLLEAVESLPQDIRDVHVLVVGDGEERENLKQQVASYQTRAMVHFLGRRLDVPQLLKLADCFVLPTLFEGMSNAIMEAMAAGLPVITTDIPENRELVVDQKSGCLVPTRSASAITDALMKLYADRPLRERLGNGAQEKIRTEFAIHIVVRNLSQFLRQWAKGV